MRGAAMSLTAAAAASGFVVFILSVSVVQGFWGLAPEVMYTSAQICALKGSTVAMNCIYSGGMPITETYWLVQRSGSKRVDLRTVSGYEGRVQYLGGCSMRITDVRESDSAEYKFRFLMGPPPGFEGSPGVFLTVTDVQVQVTTVTARPSHTEAQLECLSRCGPPGPDVSYIWFRNGQQVQEEKTRVYTWPLNPGDDVSCAVKGWEHHRSPSVYAPRLPSVSVSPSGEILEGSSVNLTCSSDANPAANYTWHKEGEESPQASGQMFTITEFTSGHIGNYYCEAQNRIGRHVSTWYLIGHSVKAVFIMNIIKLIFLVLMLIYLLLLNLGTRRKTLSSTTELNEPVEIIELDSSLVYENASDFQQRSHRGAGRAGVK